MKIQDKLKQYVRDWLNVRENMNESTITIEKQFNDRTKAFEYELWYKGDANELHQFYTSTGDYIGNTEFWKATSTTGIDFRKIHTGVPGQIVDKLVDIVADDMNEVEFGKDAPQGKADWALIEKEINFKELIKEAIAEALVTGDGAFKISYDSELSQYPIVEFYSGKDVEFDVVRGKLIGVRFYTTQIINKETYRLEEYYHDHGITYTLYDSSGSDVTNPLIEELFQLHNVLLIQPMRMAIPLVFIADKRRPRRGRSIYEGKLQAFDSCDEIWSTWIDEVRSGRTKTYIPEMLIPRNPDTGAYIKPNTFDNRFVAIGNELGENAKNMIDQKGGMVATQDLAQSWSSALDLALQGIISPATLGIDLKKLDNAESQREKEKTTLYTRNKIVRALEDTLPRLIDMILKVDLVMRKGEGIIDHDVSITFGEYANPSFDTQIQTIGQAFQMGIISLDRAVEELWGTSLDPQEKKDEISKLTMAEPSVVTEDMYG